MSYRALKFAVATAALTGICGIASAGGDALPIAVGDDPHALALARGEVVRITIDFAEVLVLPSAATTVIVGNTGIVDANPSDDRTMVLTGKAVGSTNIIAVNGEGRKIADLIVEVVAGGSHVMTIHQGVRRETFSCGRRCDPVLSVGDDAEHFDRARTQIEGRNAFSDTSGN